MVARLVRAALVHPTVVLVVALAIVAAGVWATIEAPLGVFPEFAPPIVEVQAEAPGLAAEDVEALVTTPLERALGGVRQVQVTTTPERLAAAGATLDDLATAIGGADAAAGSGFLDRPGQRLLTWFDGRVHAAADVARAPLPGRDGVPVPVGVIADV